MQEGCSGKDTEVRRHMLHQDPKKGSERREGEQVARDVVGQADRGGSFRPSNG